MVTSYALQQLQHDSLVYCMLSSCGVVTGLKAEEIAEMVRCT